MGISVPSEGGGCPDTLKSAASRDTETAKGWRHGTLWFPKIWDTRDSWISQIWDTGCHGFPKSGNTWLHSPPASNLRLPWTWGHSARP